MHMTIISGIEVVVDLPNWDGPIPSKGDYIFHPPFENTGPSPVGDGPLQNNTAGCVQIVQWRTHDRTPDGERFVQTSHPYVEITI